MLLRLSRFVKLTNVARKILIRPHTNTFKPINYACLQHLSYTPVRFYSDKGSKKDDKSKDYPHLEDCKKLQSASPCPPRKPDPTLECPYEDDNNWDNYKNAAWLGLLIAAATLGTLYLMGVFDKKEKAIIIAKKKSKRPSVRDPKHCKDIPKEVPYLLIGGGTASFSAFRAIKSADPTAKVLVITNESFFPYMRPPLSKEMWFNDNRESVKNLTFKQWNGSERNLYYEPEDFYIACKELDKSENGGVAVARGWNVSHIDVLEKAVYLDDCDQEIHYKKCLIATGSTPKSLAVFDVAMKDEKVAERVQLFRNIFDFDEVYDMFEDAKSVAIIGGGFLGSELSCALARKGKKDGKNVYQVFREPGNMAKILPEYLSNWTTRKVKAEGVNVMGNTEVIGVKYDHEKKLGLVLSNGRTIYVDQAVLAVGVEANTEMAEKSLLEVDPELGGYLVNTELMARTDLYIAGDCSCFYDVQFGRRRVEHHDHAVVTGRLAGENMTGQAKPYVHQSMFWSDLGPDVGYEAIGIVDSTLPTVGVFAKGSDKAATHRENDDGAKAEGEAAGGDKKDAATGGEDYGKGVIFYLRDDIVVGIVLWNVFNRMSVARQVLKDGRKYDDLNEVAKLFSIHEE